MAGDNSWIFDSLICFLNGPVWNAPLQSFIEEKSLIFEPTNQDNDEHRKIHEEFKNLVDLMLGSYMEDMGITTEQFEIACSNGMTEKLPDNFQQNLFEQIWAANDFDMFKRMMTQKNIELQLQALQLIEQKYGITPQLFQPNHNVTSVGVEAAQHEPEPEPTVKQLRVDVTPSEKQVFVEVIKQCDTEDLTATEKLDELSKTYLQEEKQSLENVLQSTVSAKKSEIMLKSPPPRVDDIEIKKRQEYLKAQRDKLVALKKQVRKKHLVAEIAKPEANSLRPQSAKAAEAVMDGQVKIEPATLKFRKALAEKLRSEVITQI
ncbi:uncharacterized protein CBL_08433 [Carabus blaptoides fortunei]